ARPARAAAHPPLTPLAQLKALTPAQFEEFSRLLLLAVGYQDVQRVGGSGDQGVDLWMRDAVGNLCVVQCKRYAGSVSPAVVRELYGVMARTGAREAYLITTGRVSHEAQAWIGDKHLHVWPADRLIRYAEQHLGDRLSATIQAARRAA
ncbi:MAG: restriction endonuclease, partial [Chloroflexota bacterium]|nr:restriction endonuclease [Chloroflexota bacterium]